MPGTFAITTTTTAVPLDSKRQGSVSFTVSNTSGRALRARARIVPANPLAAPWLALDGAAERPLPAAGTEQYTVLITAPPAAPAGNYPFRLDVVGVDNPDEELTQGPSVTFTVPAPPPPPKPFPWWIVIAAGALLLAIIGVVTFLVVQDNARKAAALYRGTWFLSQGDAQLQADGTTVQGAFNDYPSGQSGRLQGSASGFNRTLGGQWTLPGNQTGALAMTVDAAGTTLAGADPFCGAKDGALFPAGCGFAGPWQDNKGCTVTFAIKVAGGSLVVSGSACTKPDSLDGQLSFAPQGVSLFGTSRANAEPESYTIFLNKGATQFRGRLAVSGAWCGSRPGQPLPDPCEQVAP